MPDAIDTAAYWEEIYAECESELKELGGAPDFSMGPMTVDVEKAFDRLQRRKVECMQNIQRLGGNANIASSFSTQASGAY